MPELVSDGPETAAGSGGTSDIVDDDVDPVEAIKKLTDNLCCSLRCRDIRLDEISPRFLFGGGSRRDDDGSSCEQKALSDGLAGAFRSPGHQDAFAVAFTRAPPGCGACCHRWF